MNGIVVAALNQWATQWEKQSAPLSLDEKQRAEIASNELREMKMAKKKALRKKSKSKITRAPRKDVVKQSDSNKDKALAPAPMVKDAAATLKALELLRSQDFFNQVVSATRRMGVVGEERNKLVVFLVGTSRVLEKPLCLYVKGPSSAGKISSPIRCSVCFHKLNGAP